jgi:hypothetical protein
MAPDPLLLMSFLLIPVIAVVIYFVPSFVAARRRHRNEIAIFVLNLLLGWTLLGWVAALVWACTSDVDRPEPVEVEEQRRGRL